MQARVLQIWRPTGMPSLLPTRPLHRGDNVVAIDLITEHIRMKLQVPDMRRIYPNLEVIPSNFQVGAEWWKMAGLRWLTVLADGQRQQLPLRCSELRRPLPRRCAACTPSYATARQMPPTLSFMLTACCAW